eukprot:gnl/Dysnectes_brevis/2451_a2921_1086.p1 GENE.gnl/Dysnectes_brevis/2451_a2921_1086~~gnl/Dysnectes_brevis/2451_a2921_1086.p1  ORF type:complete len:116 (-),score=7.44 gnl/Dysnectes_brevis/2451_a2921_1086:353-700(-)
MSLDHTSPVRLMKQNLGKPVEIRLKWGTLSYHGIFVSADRYMNFRLKHVLEVREDQASPIGEVLIRCNNVLFFRVLEGTEAERVLEQVPVLAPEVETEVKEGKPEAEAGDGDTEM